MFVDDYYHMWEWVNNQANIERGLVTWEGDTFMLADHSYQEISAYVAQRLADDAIRLFQSGVDVVIVEAARGAGNPSDRYLEQLFVPIMDNFSLCFSETSHDPIVFNAETSTPFQIALERAQRRAEEDKTAPPPEILSRYMSETGANSSAHLEAKGSTLPITTMWIDTSGIGPEQVAFQIWKEVMLNRVPLLEGPSSLSETERYSRTAGAKER